MLRTYFATFMNYPINNLIDFVFHTLLYICLSCTYDGVPPSTWTFSTLEMRWKLGQVDFCKTSGTVNEDRKKRAIVTSTSSVIQGCQ